MTNIMIGTWAEIPTPYATHIMSKAGLDFSIIGTGTEHDLCCS